MDERKRLNDRLDLLEIDLILVAGEIGGTSEPIKRRVLLERRDILRAQAADIYLALEVEIRAAASS